MFDFSLWNLIAGFGASSLFVMLALSIFAPHVLSVAAEYLRALSPLVKGAADGVVFLIKGAWVAINDIADNIYTVLFVAALLLSTQVYTANSVKPDCEKCIAELRKEYRFVKKTTAEKRQDQKKEWRTWLPF
jgi:hypothetical protein